MVVGEIQSELGIAASTLSHSQVSVDLSPSQLNSIKVLPAGSYTFPVEREAVGSISLADDLSVDEIDRHQQKGEGEGKGAVAGKVAVDSQAKMVALDGYNALPVVLKGVKRQQ